MSERRPTDPDAEWREWEREKLAEGSMNGQKSSRWP